MSDSGDLSNSDDYGAPPMQGSGNSVDEDEFEFDQYTNQGADPKGKSQMIDNQHFDEAMDVSDESFDDSITSAEQSLDNHNKRSAPPAAGDSPPEFSDDDDEKSMDMPDSQVAIQNMGSRANVGQPGEMEAGQDDEDAGSESESSSEEEGGEGAGASLYNPNDYKHLNVSPEIADLFAYIGRHKPQDIELETKLRPFIPDYIPAVGDMDAFIKIPSPDDKKDELGLKVLDEPAAQQSDPTVLDLQLRVVSKQTNLKPMTVRNIENADKNPKKITTWINNIEEVHRKKPPPNVNYTKNMPDIDDLMQMWPSEFEALLKEATLPPASLDVDVNLFARISCAILDIPVYPSKVNESLHVLFTLYSEFKNNSHFQHP